VQGLLSLYIDINTDIDNRLEPPSPTGKSRSSRNVAASQTHQNNLKTEIKVRFHKMKSGGM
jgi:hypothetical protein